MNVPEIFKYNSILSIPLFTIIALLLIKKAPEFSFSRSTVSKSILVLRGKTNRVIFRLNFILKALLDFGFIWYLIVKLNISFNSLLTWFLVLSVSLFAFLSYFIEGKHSLMHKILVYSVGVFWALSQIFLSYFTGNISFIRFSYLASLIPGFLAFGFLFARKTNVIVQAVCVIILYSWLTIFVFRYL